MSKLSFIALLFFIHSLSATTKKVDEILHHIFTVGDDKPFIDDPAKVKELCDHKEYPEFKEFLDHTKGVTQKVAMVLMTSMQPPNLCAMLNDDEHRKKWAHMGASINKHKDDLKKLRFSFLKASHDAKSIPEAVCYTKRFFQKLEECLKDDPDSQKLAKGFAEKAIAEVSKIVEAEKGKIPEDCKLPEASAQEGEHCSVFMGFIGAVHRLDK